MVSAGVGGVRGYIPIPQCCFLAVRSKVKTALSREICVGSRGTQSQCSPLVQTSAKAMLYLAILTKMKTNLSDCPVICVRS